MSLSELSIRRPVMAWMLMAALIIFGLISFKRLGISNLPDVDFPVVSVSLGLVGAAPEVIESQVLDPLEDALMQIDGIRSITSKAEQGTGSIAVEFEFDRNIDEAIQEIENKIDQTKDLLPTNLYPPTVRKSNPEDQPIMWMALSSNDPKTPLIDIMSYARDTLYDQFSMVPGIGNIVLGGYADPTLRVWLDMDKMQKWDITTSDVIQTILAQHYETPSGVIENQQTSYTVRSMGETKSAQEFGEISIDQRSNIGVNYRFTQLKEVATVEESIADARSHSRSNRQTAVGLGLVKQHGSNAVEVAAAVRKKLEQVKKVLPPHFSLDIRSDNTRFIRQSVDSLNFVLLLSVILTSIVCFVFLGSWSSTFNVLLAIPTSIIGTFTALYFFGFTLNTFTMLGLSLAIGIVVDDAIMMLENIVRHRELGEKKRAAAVKGSKEITFAAIAATIAVVAIFLPVVFMRGVIGRYFLQYGLTVTVAVLLSLFEALTLTPMRCSRYLVVNHESKGFAKKVDSIFLFLTQSYQSLLGLVLKHRGKTVSIALIFFLLSLILAKFLPAEMMPAQDQSMMLFRFKLPVGTSLPFTDQKIQEVEKYLMAQKEVDGMYAVAGSADAVNQGIAFVMLVDPKKRKLTQAQLIKKFREYLKEHIEGMEIIIQDLSLRGFSSGRGFPVEFIIQGPDWNTLTKITNEIMEEMKRSGVVTDVNTDVQPGMPEIQLIPNREKLAAHGVSLSEVTNVINALMGGAVLSGQRQYQKGHHRYPIEVRLRADQRSKVEDLSRVKIRNNRGEAVPLSELVEQKMAPSLMLISRLNRFRAINVYANPAPGHAQQEALNVSEKIARMKLPPGYMIKMTGSSQSYQESFKDLIIALLLGILVSYMVLASQFNSFIHPITVLMALPFSVSGAFIGLALLHQSINIYSLIGLILLMGIVKKNSILLVDFTNTIRKEIPDVTEALLKACPVRLRPILMTSFATIAGALPEALSIGPGAETRIPMAIAIIGGVTASTFLTLFVVPCVYSLFTKWERPET